MRFVSPAFLIGALLLALTTAPAAVVADTGGCTPAERMCGATTFMNVHANVLWHRVGPPSYPTTWIGPNESSVGAPIYMVTWRDGALDGAPKGFQVVHALGTTFYFRENMPLPPDPSAQGYTAADFATADKLSLTFPDTAAMPEGSIIRGCGLGGVSYYLVTSPKSGVAFLLIAPPTLAHMLPIKEINANVAMLPKAKLKSDVVGIMDSLDYFSLGANVEVVEFASAYYYLSHQPETAAIKDFKSLAASSTSSQCPEFPQVGDKGLEYPDSWNAAVKSFKDAP